MKAAILKVTQRRRKKFKPKFKRKSSRVAPTWAHHWKSSLKIKMKMTLTPNFQWKSSSTKLPWLLLNLSNNSTSADQQSEWSSQWVVNTCSQEKTSKTNKIPPTTKVRNLQALRTQTKKKMMNPNSIWHRVLKNRYRSLLKKTKKVAFQVILNLTTTLREERNRHSECRACGPSNKFQTNTLKAQLRQFSNTRMLKW